MPPNTDLLTAPALTPSKASLALLFGCTSVLACVDIDHCPDFTSLTYLIADVYLVSCLQVIARANATRYGLAAGVFTKDINLANLISRSLQAATVWINNCWHFLDPSIPFGSYKESGTGVEGGQQGIEAYTKVGTES